MRKIMYGLCLIWLMPAMMQAQVHIQTTIPTVGPVQKNQLWNLVMVNGTGTPLEGRLELILYDRITAQELVTATTGMFTVPKGSLMLNVSMLNPVQYNYLGMEPDKNLNSLLPSGSYTACYSFARNPGNKRELLAEECVSFDTEPLSPPMLTFPSDSAVLDVQPAQFSWTPPAPLGMINNLRYEILITEVLPGQKAPEAVAENLPHYSSLLPSANFMNYPSSNPSFEKEKWYAWQVVARDNSSYAGKSEVWVFRLKSETKEAVKTNIEYIALKTVQEQKGVAQTKNNDLFVKYYSYDNVRDVTFTIYQENNAAASFTRQVVYGDNYIYFQLPRYFRKNVVYTIRVQDRNNKAYSASFTIQ